MTTQVGTSIDRLLKLLPELAAALREAAPHQAARDLLPGVSLTSRQMAALIQLRQAGEQTMSEFAAGMATGRAAATELVERLEEKGLVVRTQADADRRLTLVRLSPAAAVAAGDVVARRRADLAAVLSRHPDVDPVALFELLSDLARSLASVGPDSQRRKGAAA